MDSIVHKYFFKKNAKIMMDLNQSIQYFTIFTLINQLIYQLKTN
jgi:hypothetical protein